ncbi:hypothetical protein RvY_06109 [Ramazzottius varieornatus]|uniref:Uncharacterized protein n=1 Tax=Ramazzottius varieornatus TaxID=947166 RepID=A0A1D1UXE4_RAMVA|nr:hypothetical protein RvY_06109 [Ramazzottius varieornatus]
MASLVSRGLHGRPHGPTVLLFRALRYRRPRRHLLERLSTGTRLLPPTCHRFHGRCHQPAPHPAALVDPQDPALKNLPELQEALEALDEAPSPLSAEIVGDFKIPFPVLSSPSLRQHQQKNFAQHDVPKDNDTRLAELLRVLYRNTRSPLIQSTLSWTGLPPIVFCKAFSTAFHCYSQSARSSS